MRGLRISAMLAATALAIAWAAAPASAAEKVPGEVIVQFERGADSAERAGARADAGTAEPENLGSRGLEVVQVVDGDSVGETIEELESDPAVRFAEPNAIEQLSAVPNDPSFPSLWGLRNTGQTVGGATGIPGADIDAPRAWDIETGDPETVIAVMDSGIDPTHPDLAPNLWRNPGEVAGNGVDDDGNGFVDDVHGFDFVGSEDGGPLDAVGHGTHVSGTIAGVGNNGTGITGVSQRAQIMSLRACGVSGCSTADTIQAINYAADNGARVLNGSIGGFSNDESQARREAIFSHPNVLHVFAAGNESANADNAPAECPDSGTDPDPCRAYPCAHAAQGGQTENVVCVAATTQIDTRPTFSNIGPASVDLGAPGTNVLSANAEREYLDNSFSSAAEFTNQWNLASGVNWQHTFESPITNGGITDSPAADYVNNTTYGTITDNLPVGAVSERGCFVNLARSIALAPDDDRFRVALLHSDPAADQQYSFSSVSNSGLVSRTLTYTPPAAAGNLNVLVRLQTGAAGTANGVHISSVRLECGETPGPHNFGLKSGTSMASPHVAGAAGLLISRNPAASTTEIRDKLLSTVDAKAGLAGVTVTGGRLNIGRAVSQMPADTSITGGPAEGSTIGARSARRGGGPVKGAFPIFSYSSNDPSATFQCSVDGGSFAPCASGSPIGPLGPGPHSLVVRSIDPRGNADTTPATRSFSVEGDPPETTITKSPKKRTSSRKAKFKFTSDEPGATFECKVDKKPFKPCVSPHKIKKVKPKRHRFQVVATDAVGNVDPTVAKKRWRVTKKKR